MFSGGHNRPAGSLEGDPQTAGERLDLMHFRQLSRDQGGPGIFVGMRQRGGAARSWDAESSALVGLGRCGGRGGAGAAHRRPREPGSHDICKQLQGRRNATGICPSPWNPACGRDTWPRNPRPWPRGMGDPALSAHLLPRTEQRVGRAAGGVQRLTSSTHPKRLPALAAPPPPTRPHILRRRAAPPAPQHGHASRRLARRPRGALPGTKRDARGVRGGRRAERLEPPGDV
jgi:hypothetical protein